MLINDINIIKVRKKFFIEFIFVKCVLMVFYLKLEDVVKI